MFSGIIEDVGMIVERYPSDNNMQLWISCSFINELKIDQSVAHNGICLTIDALSEGSYRVTLITQTLRSTTAADWPAGSKINLERSLRLSDRLDGHLVQGHIDAVGLCSEIADAGGSLVFTFQYPEEFSSLIIEKGAIAVNGVSLTAFECSRNLFKVALIPYTLAHTNFKDLKAGEKVNLEFDIVGKYIIGKGGKG